MTAVNEHRNAFEELCSSQYDLIEKFREAYPDLVIALGGLLEAGAVILGSISFIRNMTNTEAHRWMMWQTVAAYLQQSLLLIVTANTDAGLALIRLASELSRDVAVIRDDEARLELWFKRRDSAWQRKYRSVFRFSDEPGWGAMAHQAYNLCSDFGIHGHMSDAMHLRPTGTSSASGHDDLLTLKVSDSGVLSALRIWLIAFAPLNLLCLETYSRKHRRTLAQPYHLFMKMVEAIDPVVKAITARLRELAALKAN